MNRQAVNERLKAAPNPVLRSYRKIVDQHRQQVIDQNHVGWRILEFMVNRHRNCFFDAQGHWRSWRDHQLQALARSEAANAVNIGVTLTRYWRGHPLNLMQSAIIKPYLHLDPQKLLH